MDEITSYKECFSAAADNANIELSNSQPANITVMDQEHIDIPPIAPNFEVPPKHISEKCNNSDYVYEVIHPVTMLLYDNYSNS